MDTLIFQDDIVIRKVRDLASAEFILQKLTENHFFDEKIVPTKISSDIENALEHKLLRPILHSEEYTVSMAYDVAELALKMALEAEKSGIYSFDLLPHNFTFYYGKWVLYDFGAFQHIPDNVKTQIRGCFQIPFASFQLLKYITRKDLGKCFLNRFSVENMFNLLPMNVFFEYFFKLVICKFLLFLKQYKACYSYLLRILHGYKNVFDRKEFFPDKNIVLPDFFDKLIKENRIETVFWIGKTSAQYSLLANNIKSFVYLDDYDFCDGFYNYIIDNKLQNISTGVIYPLADDEIIPKVCTYRALYDSYAQKRFCSDCVFITDFKDISSDSDLKEVIKNIASFSEKLLIIRLSENNESILLELKKIFNEVSETIIGGELFVISSGRKAPILLRKPHKKYQNNNRGLEKLTQFERISGIVKK